MECAAVRQWIRRRRPGAATGPHRGDGRPTDTARAARPDRTAVRRSWVPGCPTPAAAAYWSNIMIHSPLETKALFHVGPVAVTEAVIITWVIMAALVGFAIAVTCRLSAVPSKKQTVLELFVGAIDDQIRSTMQVEPGPYRALIGTIFIFILVANWSSLIPGVEPPTAHLRQTPPGLRSCFAPPSSTGSGRAGLPATCAPLAN